MINSARLILAALLPWSQTSRSFVAPFAVEPPRLVLRAEAGSKVASGFSGDRAGPSIEDRGLLPYLDKAAREDTLFRTDPAVVKWRQLAPRGPAGDRQAVLDFLASVLWRASPLERAVWSNFALRTAFFGFNAAAAGLFAIGGARGAVAELPVGDPDAAFALYEFIQAYEQELRFIEAGLLRYPWDYVVQKPMGLQPVRILWNHRQSNPLFAMGETLKILNEAAAIMKRYQKYNGRPSGSISVPAEGRVPYPRYYLNDFHYQTDGWLSDASADRYEVSTETIFVGTQDVMQRQTILPLSVWHHGRDSKSSQGSPMRILEVACGTGRFATFVRDNFPTAGVTLTDLSPFYLNKARENDRYWRRLRGREAMREATGASSAPTPVETVQANAEHLPFLDDSFDTILCVYLFHELPGPARRRAAREMARVVKPGGLVVLSDSIQLGDRASYGFRLDAFGRLNEPHYVGYQRCDLPQLFMECGLVCDSKYVNSRTKTLSFVKPKS